MSAHLPELRAQDEQLQRHLSECVECWESLAEQEERNGIDLGLPCHPEVTSPEAAALHSDEKGVSE